MKIWLLFYYICFPGNGCADYVPVARYERFADCRVQRNLYIREQLRYWRRYGADGNAICVELDTGMRPEDYAPTS